MSNDWYANRIAQQRGQRPGQAAPQQQPVYQHPQQVQQPQIIGYTQDGQPIYNAPPQQANPMVYQGPPQPTAHPQLSEQEMIQAALNDSDPRATPMDVLERAGMKGGKGTRTETDLCPECGSNHFFTRKALSKFGAAPAPYCHECGYNGMFEQHGNQGE